MEGGQHDRFQLCHESDNSWRSSEVSWRDLVRTWDFFWRQLSLSCALETALELWLFYDCKN